MKKYSIIIPTYNHLEDCLKPCIDSILKYTDTSNLEIIIVANGCIDGTNEYLLTLDNNIFVPIIEKKQLGYTKSTNIGIKAAAGQYIILLNNDVILLDQPKNQWLDMMEEPFNKLEKVAISGPLRLHDVYVNAGVMIFFCVMIPKIIFDEIGILDEIFSPGGGEDIDFTLRVVNAGYKCIQVPSDEKIEFTGTNTSIYPIWHQNNKTFGEIPEYGKTIIKKNGLLNLKRYNKNIKLNVGSGYLHLQNYNFIGVDDKDPSADIFGDFCELDFDANSVTEIYAGHVLHHIPIDRCDKFINKCFNVLKSGGFVAFEVPNMQELCKEYIIADNKRKEEIIKLIFEPIEIGGHIYSAASAWEPNILREKLEKAGFCNIIIGDEVVPRAGHTFRIQAGKP